MRDVRLPLSGWRFDGQRVDGDAFAGTIHRLSRRWVEAVLDAALPPLTNVKLRVTDPESARASGDLYGKVTGEIERAGARLTRIHLTSVDPADAALIDGLVAAAPASPGARGVS